MLTSTNPPRNMVSDTHTINTLLSHKALTLSLCETVGSPESCGQEALPPVGVFWDIENCAVPSGRSAATVVQRLRERFFHGHREAEFICVCDINKENKAVIQELNNCQVNKQPIFLDHYCLFCCVCNLPLGYFFLSPGDSRPH